MSRTNGASLLRSALEAALSGSGTASSGTVHLLGESLELSPITRGLLARFPDQTHLLPAADASLVGIAVGIAMGGGAAVICLSGPDALWGTAQQLGQEAGLSGGEFPLNITVRVPLAPGAQVPLALLGALSVQLIAPAHAGQLGTALQAAIAHQGPSVLLEPLACMDAPAADAIPASTQIVQTGSHVSLLAWGHDGLLAAIDAAAVLEAEGIQAEVVSLISLRAQDIAVATDSVKKTGRPVLIGAPRDALHAITQGAFLRLESPPESCEARTQAICSAAQGAARY